MYKTLSVIIPVFNEEKFINQIITNVIASDTRGLKKEIIVVNDGSTDKTAKILDVYKDRIKIITKKRGGKGSALKKGFLASSGDIVLVQDADLEYNPDEYPLLLEPFLKKNADVVFGSRFISDRPHRVLYFWHSLGNSFLTLFSNMLTNLNLTDMETGYKVFRGSIIRKIAQRLESRGFGFEPEIIARLAKIPHIQIYEIGISYQGRTYTDGKKIMWYDGVKAIWEIIKFNIFVK